MTSLVYQHHDTLIHQLQNPMIACCGSFSDLFWFKLQQQTLWNDTDPRPSDWRAPTARRAGSEGRYEVSVGHRRSWQMGCTERWDRRHSRPPGKPVSSPPGGADTHCITHRRSITTAHIWTTEGTVHCKETTSNCGGCDWKYKGGGISFLMVM